MKKFKYSLLILSFIVCSCNINSKTETKNSIISTTTKNVKEKAVDNINHDRETQKALYKTLNKKTPLTNDQLFAILPKEINGNKPFDNNALQVSNQLASGVYGPIGKHYNYYIQDGAGSSAIVRNFYNGYTIKSQGPPETEYIYLERDGYNTIAFLQPKIKRNNIGFIYNNRFKISIEGPDDDTILWSYIDFENLKNLDQFN
jgi:hypothetical protein